MNDTQLEQLLRRTFAEQAATVTSGPRMTGNSPVTDASRRRRHTWLAPIAAAAAVLAVVAGVLAAARPAAHRPPAAPSSVPSISSAPPISSESTSPIASPSTSPAVPPVAAKVCPLPGAWKAAYAEPGQDFGATEAKPLAVATDGTVVLYLDYGPKPGAAREVALLTPGAKTPTVAFRVAQPDRYGVAAAGLYEHWLVVAEGEMSRPAKGEEPGSSSLPNVHELDVIDLTTGAVRTLATTTPGSGPTIDEAALVGGTVQWIRRAHYGAEMADWHTYELTTGKSSYASAPISYLPAINPLGVFSSDTSVQVSPSLVPGDLDQLLPKDVAVRRTVVTDGTDYAWLQNKNVIGWWSPGNGVRDVRVPSADIDDYPYIAVSGPLVFEGDTGEILDTRTGAVTKLPSTSKSGVNVAGVTNSSTLATWSYAPIDGQWIDGYWLDPQPQLVLIDTRRLPPISC